MSSTTTRWWIAVLLATGLAVAGCADDDGGSGGDAAEATAAAGSADEAGDPEANDGAGDAIGVMTLGDEEFAMDGLRCFFEEQPRAGLGGVFTHTAQGSGTNAAGEPVVLDLSRARAEDGAVVDDISVDIGEPTSEDAVSLGASGPEGLITFGDASATAEDVEVSEFGADPVTLSFDLPCR